MNDEEFKKLCEDFNKMEEEIKEVTLVFSSVDNHLHRACDKMEDIIVSGDITHNTKNSEND